MQRAPASNFPPHGDEPVLEHRSRGEQRVAQSPRSADPALVSPRRGEEGVLENPRSGERIVVRQRAADTDGQLFVFDLYLQPGGHVPAGHVHPRQAERFTVVEGQVRFRLGRSSLLAGPGETLVIPSGTAHWFGNGGRVPAHLRVEVRPALRMEELLETTVERAASDSAWWMRLLEQVLIPFDFPSELGVPNVPASLVSAVLAPLAWLRVRLRPSSG